jgi:hypothetical protein
MGAAEVPVPRLIPVTAVICDQHQYNGGQQKLIKLDGCLAEQARSHDFDYKLPNDAVLQPSGSFQ